MKKDTKRRVARVAVVLSVALSAGHYVQSTSVAPAEVELAGAEGLQISPERLEKLSAPAGPEPASPEATNPEITAPESAAAEPAQPEAPAPESAPVPAAAMPVQSPPAEPAPIQIAAASPAGLPSETSLPAAQPPAPALPRAEKEPAAPDTAATTPTTEPAQSGQAVPQCDPKLDLMSDDMAMIGVTFVAPCQGAQTITLRHADLAFPATLTASGSYFAFVPALQSPARIEIRMGDGTKLDAEIEVPVLKSVRRFAVQWQAPDGLLLRAFEDGTDYAAEGGISAQDPRLPIPGELPRGGYLHRFGDAQAGGGLMADIYTFPPDPASAPNVVVEVPVDATTCGREVLAQTILSTNGTTEVKDITLQTPDCSDIGGFLVLNNLVPQQTIAASN